MNNYRAEAFNPKTGKVEEADWLDNQFGHHIYGVQFKDGNVYHSYQVGVGAACAELERLRHDNDRLQRIASEAVTERDRLKEQLEKAQSIIKGFSDLYVYAWDRVDGGLMMMESGVDKFEAVHEKAYVFLNGPRPDFTDTDDPSKSGLCAGGIDPGWDECPKCGATDDEKCAFSDEQGSSK